MDGFREPRRAARELTAAALYLGTAVSVAVALLRIPNPLAAPASEHVAEGVAFVSPLVFLCACVLVFVRPRFGHSLGLFAGLIALPWFVWTELWLSPANSWVFLNTGDESVPEALALLALAKLKILSIALIVFAILYSSLRLLPSRLLLGKSPLRQRTWPAFALGFLMLAAWFIHSVTPYRVPLIVDGESPQFRILHVEKRGLRYHETEVFVFRDGRAWVWRNDRRLFQYRFEARVAMISLGAYLPTLDHARAFVKSPELRNLHTPPAKALRSWNADGWYVALRDSRPLAFSSEYRTVPPPEVTNLFYEIEKEGPALEYPATVRDVCLGFCYNSVAWFSGADNLNSNHP
jgi:hypothetical protein